MLIKDQYDIENLRISAKFTEFNIKKLITEVENIIENNSSEKHDEICKKIELIIDNDSKKKEFERTLK